MRTSQKFEVRSQKSLEYRAWGIKRWIVPFPIVTLSNGFALIVRKHGLRSPVFRLLIWFLSVGLVLASCHQGQNKTEPVKQSDESGIAEFAFSEEMHNFGSLNAGEIVSFTFTFRNTGNKTLEITNVDSGCGCTEIKIPEKSIAPGDEGQIEVIYNSAGEVGNQLKTITITTNAEQAQKQLFIRANVTNDLIKIYS